ncbi:DUF5691 domain-containing protein [Bradyrhizobium sp. GCM10027634]|uniref:DUF5691 domain-containing protein n=1 Tax=unclassified Bradyrhizobium TaxID=2631580 RepID=UPI00188BB65E|nr:MULTISPECIES: DUF5691 domain-containing protein [unclassified Bradyrhizobium]MDN5001686.1 DUF5691 domain-containing protein [Bradyrhizobium sp. WYCCWR 12677]QOZ45987.1 hypothetical protein XH89_22795 [Bradyrhizobium sp. CCBAU 53340]
MTDKADEIYDAMGAVLTRWTMGSAAASAAPFWRAELGEEPAEAELRLLALSGQFLGITVTAEPASTLRVLPDIPTLALPTLPETLRPLARRILAAKKQAQGKTELVDFLAARGWTMHPADWMPTAGDDDAPDVYAPWRDWMEFAASNNAARRQTNDHITAGNWDDFWPAARKAALAELRRHDPSAARAVLEAKLGNESADTRLRLLSLLSERLSNEDIAFLEAIVADDRAPKVKALATSFLARLGHGPAAGEEIAELAGFFAVKTKGLLRRSRVIDFQTPKTPAQWQRRKALLDGTDLTSFAGALGLAPLDLIAAWEWKVDTAADAGLIKLIAETGTDAQLAQAAQIVSEHNAAGFIVALAPRLAPTDRTRFAAVGLHTHGIGFEMAQVIAGAAARLDDPLSAPSGVKLLAEIRRDDAKPSDHAAEFHALGLLTSQTAAQQTLQRLTAAGLLQGDPRLDMLRLNAALDDQGEKP